MRLTSIRTLSISSTPPAGPSLLRASSVLVGPVAASRAARPRMLLAPQSPTSQSDQDSAQSAAPACCRFASRSCGAFYAPPCWPGPGAGTQEFVYWGYDLKPGLPPAVTDLFCARMLASVAPCYNCRRWARRLPATEKNDNGNF